MLGRLEGDASIGKNMFYADDKRVREAQHSRIVVEEESTSSPRAGRGKMKSVNFKLRSQPITIVARSSSRHSSLLCTYTQTFNV